MGLVVNFRFAEIADFLGGLATFDLCGDDGRDQGDWPWRRGPDVEPRKPVPAPKLPY